MENYIVQDFFFFYKQVVNVFCLNFLKENTPTKHLMISTSFTKSVLYSPIPKKQILNINVNNVYACITQKLALNQFFLQELRFMLLCPANTFTFQRWEDLSLSGNSLSLLQKVISQSLGIFEGLSASQKLTSLDSAKLRSLLQSQKFISFLSAELESLLQSQKLTSRDFAEFESLVQSLRKLASSKNLRSANSSDLADLLSLQRINSISSSGSGRFRLDETSSDYNTRSKNSLSWINSYSSSFGMVRELGLEKRSSKLDSSESLQVEFDLVLYKKKEGGAAKI